MELCLSRQCLARERESLSQHTPSLQTNHITPTPIPLPPPNLIRRILRPKPSDQLLHFPNHITNPILTPITITIPTPTPTPNNPPRLPPLLPNRPPAPNFLRSSIEERRDAPKRQTNPLAPVGFFAGCQFGGGAFVWVYRVQVFGVGGEGD